LESLGTRGLDYERLKHRLPAVANAIRKWVGQAEGEKFDLLLRAVDVRVKASSSELTIEGAIPVSEPVDDPDLVTIERTSA
jgi:hypothetical protein